MKSRIDAVQTTAPVTVLTAPAAGATMPPSSLTLTAAVNSNGKIIKKVEFYDGASLLGLETNTTHSLGKSIYSFTCNNVPVGAKSVLARAYYGTSSRADSAPVSFTVAEPTPIKARMVAQGSNLFLIWNGGPGSFRVQTTTDLRAGSWQYITDASTNTSRVITPSNAAAFYRIVRP